MLFYCILMMVCVLFMFCFFFFFKQKTAYEMRISDWSSDVCSSDLLKALLTSAGHILAARALIKDEADLIVSRLHNWIDDSAVDVVITTGGTGLTGRDVTPEALRRLDGKDIPGFGELFRWLSYQSIGTTTIQSRDCAVVARGTYIFALPGSTGAVKAAWEGILSTQQIGR